eukprot:RCo019115
MSDSTVANNGSPRSPLSDSAQLESEEDALLLQLRSLEAKLAQRCEKEQRQLTEWERMVILAEKTVPPHVVASRAAAERKAVAEALAAKRDVLQAEREAYLRELSAASPTKTAEQLSREAEERWMAMQRRHHLR